MPMLQELNMVEFWTWIASNLCLVLLK
jgi:hypothetical protein